MLQFHVEHCCIESNPGGCSNSYTGYYTLQAHKVRRYIQLFVASEGVINTKRSITPPKELACPVEFYSTGVSDVEGFIPERTHVVNTNNKLIRLRRISAFHPLSSLRGTQRRIFIECY